MNQPNAHTRVWVRGDEDPFWVTVESFGKIRQAVQSNEEFVLVEDHCGGSMLIQVDEIVAAKVWTPEQWKRSREYTNELKRWEDVHIPDDERDDEPWKRSL